MTDDMGWGDLSGYGRKDYQTPNLDKLASQGIKFVNAYSAAPICTPTRTAFVTRSLPAKLPSVTGTTYRSKKEALMELTSILTFNTSLMKPAHKLL
jgi:hypothetical protein